MKKYEILDDCIKVEVGDGSFTYIDKEDVCLVEQFPSWQNRKGHISLERHIYTEYGAIPQRIYLHRAIMIRVFGLSKMKVWQVDHKDRDKSNNRRSNLRLATSYQNCANVVKKTRSKTGYRGVCIANRKLKKPYIAYIGGEGTKHRNLGYFDNPIEAAKAYDCAAINKWGEFAILNFP